MTKLTRRALGALLLSAPFARAAAPVGQLRVGYQKIGALPLLKGRRVLEDALAPQGVAVSWHEFPTGPSLLEALNGGAIDFGYTGDTPPVFAQAAGADLLYVASQPAPGQSSAILVRKDSPIRALADLKGRTVAVTKGSSAHNVLVRALRYAGLEWRDIRPAYLSPSDAAAAFRRGAVDAWSIWDPFYAVAEQDPDTRVLTNAVGIAPSNQFFLARRPIVQAAPGVITQVIGEIARATKWIESNQDELVRVLSRETGVPEAAERVAAARGNYDVGFVTDSVVVQQQAIADTFHDLGIIPQPIRVRDAVWTPAT